MKGTVKFFNETKGFGFISPEEGKDVFVHKSSLQANVHLDEGDEVTFDVEQDDKGQKAINVKKGSADVEPSKPEVSESQEDANEPESEAASSEEESVDAKEE